MEICLAFIQLYREDGHYLERTAPWLERKGLDWIKEQLFDDPDAVPTLAARFRFSQSHWQVDPWERRAKGQNAKLHSHLSIVPLELETA